MHTYSNTEFQNLIPVITSNVSSNRIKIQEILLIRNRLLLQVIHFRNAPFEAVTLQSSTETSRTAILHEEVLQDSSAPIPAPIPAPILHVHITLQSREFSIQNPILHAEDKELFEYHYYIQRAKDLHSRNSTHRRQGDLLEMHPCVFQATPVAPMTFQSFQTFQRHSRHSSHS